MKFDTPATTNPIDQLKVVGQPVDRIDGPLKTTGTAPYAYERHDVVPQPGLRLYRRLRHRQGADRLDRPDRGQTRARCPRHRHRRQCGQARQRYLEHRHAARRPGNRALSSSHRARRRGNLRAGTRRRTVWSGSTMCGQGAFDLAAPRIRPRRAKAAKACAGPDTAVGDFAGAFASAPVQIDADLYHPRPDACDDGAACHDRGVGGRSAHRLDLQPDDRLDGAATWRNAWHPQGQGTPHLALYRRRLRRQTVPAGRHPARGTWRAGGGASREGGAAPAPGQQQHHSPPGNHPAHPDRRRPRRQDHRNRARELVRQSARWQARERGPADRACSMRAPTG